VTPRPACPASPAGTPHRWIAWRQPVLGPLAEWTCATCGADVAAPADASGCAPDLRWPALAELLAAAS
jgi:hypothetical protein